VEKQIGRHALTMETGYLAKQADGAVLVRYGETVILATAVAAAPRPDQDFFPLTVDYREKTSAAGKFPGGFIKREGRPTTKEILTMRLIDRPLRPLFPEGYMDELQVMAVVLSADKLYDPDVLSIIGSSAALHISQIPFLQAIGAVRVGRVGGEFILFPTHAELEESDLDLVVAGTAEAIMMVEAGAKEVAESLMLDALAFGHAAVKEIVGMIEDLRRQCGKPKAESVPAPDDGELAAAVRRECLEEMKKLTFVEGKLTRQKELDALLHRLFEKFATPSADGKAAKWTKSQVHARFVELERKVVREFILEGRRPDGRGLQDIRNIDIQIGVLPRTHGSAVFTRGETQALCMVTLGTIGDEQIIDGLQEEYKEHFMLHYNFPPFCVGEVKPVRGPSRRDIGHGALAQRALDPVIPDANNFPYSMRVISDILESNGSSSMATVCGATLSLMDAGVPIHYPVAGIAMGLVEEGGKAVILSDIQGAEDYFGDMDFKVAGTARGITAIQLDIKVGGISQELMGKALEEARLGRVEILRRMLSVIPRPRADLSAYAPRLVRLTVAQDQIGAVIGPGGRVIRAIQTDTGTEIEIEDDGTVTISGSSEEGVNKARQMIEGLTAKPEVGKVYEGTVVSIKEFGAFVEILPEQDGLCHVSELSDTYVRKIDEVVKLGDKIKVKVIAIDEQGRIKLSRKAVLKEEKDAAKGPKA
jgi:polyribonucleotide nucleotidyltransferase